MYLRDFLYLGFNEDEAHRKVFDAVRILIPGTHRLFANVEFADPDVYSRQDEHHDFVSYSHPPLTYAVTTDPISGVRDGILKRPGHRSARVPRRLGQRVLADECLAERARRPRQAGPGAGQRAAVTLLSSHSHGGGAGVAATADVKRRLRIPHKRRQRVTTRFFARFWWRSTIGPIGESRLRQVASRTFATARWLRSRGRGPFLPENPRCEVSGRPQRAVGAGLRARNSDRPAAG